MHNALVVAAHNKPEALDKLIYSAYDQTDLIVIIDNASDEPVDYIDGKIHTIFDDQQPPNLSRLWNVGLDEVKSRFSGGGEWNVAVTNDDTILPNMWFDVLGQHLRASTAAVAFSDQFNQHNDPVLFSEAKTVSAFDRMCGYAHLSKGEIGIRFDETMHWWYSDDDYDWQCRVSGGSLLVPGIPVVHTGENQAMNTSTYLQERASLDREVFFAKWGAYPC